MKRIRLDLGCGLTPRKGFLGVDLYTGPKRVDLTVFPWPWADNSVDEVWCSHFIEHMPRGLWAPFVDELYRILKPGAKATIIHPNLKSARAFQDPTHCDFIPVERWYYVQQSWREANGLDHPPYPTCDFDVEVGAMFAPEFTGRTDEAVAQSAVYQWDVALDLQAILIKRG